MTATHRVCNGTGITNTDQALVGLRFFAINLRRFVMRSRFRRILPLACVGLVGLVASPVSAQPRNKKSPTEADGDKSIEKQSAWEQKVMGEDGAKKADMKKIAAAQKLAEEARKNPPPEPVVHHKDPNKEGVRAKRESTIGLPIESEEAEKTAVVRKAPVAKKVEPSNSANDELGALVAASLASEKQGSSASDNGGNSEEGVARATSKGHGRRSKGRGKASASAGKASAAPGSLDRMLAGGK